jgi:hypothetical protein
LPNLIDEIGAKNLANYTALLDKTRGTRNTDTANSERVLKEAGCL